MFTGSHSAPLTGCASDSQIVWSPRHRHPSNLSVPVTVLGFLHEAAPEKEDINS